MSSNVCLCLTSGLLICAFSVAYSMPSAESALPTHTYSEAFKKNILDKIEKLDKYGKQRIKKLATHILDEYKDMLERALAQETNSEQKQKALQMFYDKSVELYEKIEESATDEFYPQECIALVTEIKNDSLVMDILKQYNFKEANASIQFFYNNSGEKIENKKAEYFRRLTAAERNNAAEIILLYLNSDAGKGKWNESSGHINFIIFVANYLCNQCYASLTQEQIYDEMKNDIKSTYKLN